MAAVGILAQGAARRDGVEHDGGGLSGQLRQVDRGIDGPQVEDRRPARDQDEVGGPGRGQGRILGVRGRVDEGQCRPRLAGRVQDLVEAGRLGGSHGGLVLGPMIAPAGGAGLRVEVDDGRRTPRLLGGDGEMEGQRRLAGPALLGDDRDGLHVELL